MFDPPKFANFPSPVLKLRQLEFLDLCSNQIETLPSGIEYLDQLETLLLFDNRLSSLPDEIGQLERLRCLWVGDNYLERLPPTFIQLQDLIWSPLLCPSVTVDGNPLTAPPPKICKAGLDEIERFMTK
ncbi:Malignant fibrous histiocytoma-amplified sequence 1 [Fasciola gigantica]|uniref:Malignant fibrous histiocytoma-amplified sequence 1 n=1 Tax=Fasciola gigantica TaxID=46835 RepID=A0A504YQW8_FASGI|nr:Malignant fibrous histiocytoma-amplified sequence 1 [Fasciola gigantica]